MLFCMNNIICGIESNCIDNMQLMISRRYLLSKLSSIDNNSIILCFKCWYSLTGYFIDDASKGKDVILIWTIAVLFVKYEELFFVDKAKCLKEIIMNAIEIVTGDGKECVLERRSTQIRRKNVS